MSIFDFSTRLREARLKAGISQKELGEISGVTPATISFYEKSTPEKPAKPSLENASLLANALDVSLDWLCGNDRYNQKREKTPEEILGYIVDIVNYFGADNCLLMPTTRSWLTASGSYLERMVGEITLAGSVIHDFIKTIATFINLHHDGNIEDDMLAIGIQGAIEKYSKKGLVEYYADEIWPDVDREKNDE